MSISSENSFEYGVYKYIDQGSENHPSIDRDVISVLSSYDSHEQPSQARSENIINFRSMDTPKKTRTIVSEPIRKTPIVLLTEEELARHNQIIKQEIQQDEPEDDHAMLELMDEKCRNIQQNFNERMKKLEEQFEKAEQEFHQTRNDLKELDSMEKEFLNQGVQTELRNEDMEHVENALKDLSLNPVQLGNKAKKWKNESEELLSFAARTRKIVWDTPFVAVESICRQLSTGVHLEGIEDDEDICDYHRERYYKAKDRMEKDRQLHQHDNAATLSRLSKMVYHH